MKFHGVGRCAAKSIAGTGREERDSLLKRVQRGPWRTRSSDWLSIAAGCGWGALPGGKLPVREFGRAVYVRPSPRAKR
jgi:hypothetical protein